MSFALKLEFVDTTPQAIDDRKMQWLNAQIELFKNSALPVCSKRFWLLK